MYALFRLINKACYKGTKDYYYSTPDARPPRGRKKIAAPGKGATPPVQSGPVRPGVWRGFSRHHHITHQTHVIFMALGVGLLILIVVCLAFGIRLKR